MAIKTLASTEEGSPEQSGLPPNQSIFHVNPWEEINP
jgi:hypothetical protein